MRNPSGRVHRRHSTCCGPVQEAAGEQQAPSHAQAAQPAQQGAVATQRRPQSSKPAGHTASSRASHIVKTKATHHSYSRTLSLNQLANENSVTQAGPPAHGNAGDASQRGISGDGNGTHHHESQAGYQESSARHDGDSDAVERETSVKENMQPARVGRAGLGDEDQLGIPALWTPTLTAYPEGLTASRTSMMCSMLVQVGSFKQEISSAEL